MKANFMSDRQLLEIMAYADGELDASRRHEVEKQIAEDPSAAALHLELTACAALLRAHEPLGAVPETREFYWSRIQRRIAAEEQAAARAKATKVPAFGWLRWLAPAIGVAALALVVTYQQRPGPTILAVGEASSMTFTSEADGVTISWIN
jgi:anti-sigma factor RsiW